MGVDSSQYPSAATKGTRENLVVPTACQFYGTM